MAVAQANDISRLKVGGEEEANDISCLRGGAVHGKCDSFMPRQIQQPSPADTPASYPILPPPVGPLLPPGASSLVLPSCLPTPLTLPPHNNTPSESATMMPNK